MNEFFRFGVVGLFGLVIDTATVYGLRFPLGLYGAGLIAYFTATSATWALNRLWTFRGRGQHRSAPRQWVMFMTMNLCGFVLNRSTYALLVTFVAVAARQPVIAVAAGSLAGLLVNFNLSRRVVFTDGNLTNSTGQRIRAR